MKQMMMAAGFGIWGGMALAAVNTDALVADLQQQGYSWIEVKRGPTQIEVEAVRGTEKIETVYDIATGEILDHEIDRASRREQNRTGVKVRDSLRDFEDRDDDDDHDDDDRWDDDRDDRHDRDDDRDDRDDDRDDRDDDRDDRDDRGGRDRDHDDD